MAMAIEVLKDYPSELEIGSSIESFQKAMESQKQLFHGQIDQLRSIVVTQCKLTGVNPLSQEMAAGALSINIGKRPRDLLNPKAVKYMQSVFSIKDAISKKETREIGALFGVTVTQVREYFTSQRTRVRKMVRLSREKAIRTSMKALEDVVSTDSDLMLPIDPVPLSSVGPSNAEEAPSCSNQDDILPGLGESEKQFVGNIFSSMCREETFSGQVKVMEWILQIDNPSVLCWFLTKGGVMILATWLSQAASEEQTSVLTVALKVLCHLPLHKALSVHMSAILQAVNRLRFYRISDISNRARVLLSKWSKMFAKSQASRKPNGVKSTGDPEIDLRQRIGELIGDGSWQSSVENPNGVLVPLDGGVDDPRKMEAPKLLTASSDDSNKKHILGTSTHNKERRKVLLVEQPGQKTAGKSQQVKAVPAGANQARPITADEIQKAKMRAQFMQSNKRKSEGPKKPSMLTNDFLSASEAYLRPKLEAQKKARLLPPKNSKVVDLPSDQKPNFDQKESLLEKCRRVQIPWQAPPEVEVNPAWELGIGVNSKEIDAQNRRMLREKETIYRTLQEVPANPKEPWDVEMDYDDTLTPEIPMEQLPENDYADTAIDTSVSENQNDSATLANLPSTSSVSGNGAATAEPDLELLAVLLKNPELVFALTSGQASGLSSEDTVKLLDMLKCSSGGAALLNGQAQKLEEKKFVEDSLPSPTPSRNVEVSLPSPTPPSRFEVSLPSPTPSCNPGPSGWASQDAKNPFSRHTVTSLPAVATAVTVSDRPQDTSTLHSQFVSPPSRSAVTLENQPPFFTQAPTHIPPMNHHSFNPAIHNERLPSSISSYSHPPPLSQPQMRFQHHVSVQEQYHPPVPEDSNRAMLKVRHGLAHNSFSTHGNQNVHNPTVGVGHGHRQGSGAFPGPPWERNEFHPGGRNGFESISPENSPARYQEHHRHGQGHGWSYQEQRGYHGPPPDRVSRYQNSPGFRDHNWNGGGGNRRWHDDGRRR